MNKNPETFYKYRSIQDFKRFVDILVHNRLYATEFDNLNDPMEGVFEYSTNIDSSIIGNLKSEKFKTKICSLSKTPYNDLMWSFYADEHKGCCIEVEPVGNSWTRLDVDYGSTIYNLTANSSVEDILSRKSKHWEHEQEVRFIKTLDPKKNVRISSYLKVKIKTIYLGIRMDEKDKNLVRKIVGDINKDIVILDMKKTDIDFGYL